MLICILFIFIYVYLFNFSVHVLTEDTISREVRDGKLYSRRILSKTNHVPKWGERFYKNTPVKIIEDSVLDPVNKTLITFTRNIGFKKIMVSLMNNVCVCLNLYFICMLLWTLDFEVYTTCTYVYKTYVLLIASMCVCMTKIYSRNLISNYELIESWTRIIATGLL